MFYDDEDLFFLCGETRLDVVTVYLIFLLELLHRTKLQQTHVDQLLQVLVKCEDVFPNVKKPINPQFRITAMMSSGENKRERKSPFIKQLSFHSGRQRSDKMVLLHRVTDIFLQSIHLWTQVNK